MTDLLNGIDPSTPGQVVAHCSEDDGRPDVGISIGLGAGKVLWIGTLLNADGGDFGVAFHDGGARRAAAPFMQWDALVEIFADRVAPAIAATAMPDPDADFVPSIDITPGLASKLSEDEAAEVAGKIAETALASAGGYITAANTIMQGAAALLATKMPARDAGKMMVDMARFWRGSIVAQFATEGSVQ